MVSEEHALATGTYGGDDRALPYQVEGLDVRDPREIAELGTLEGYVNIPLPQLEQRLGEIPKSKAIVTA